MRIIHRKLHYAVTLLIFEQFHLRAAVGLNALFHSFCNSFIQSQEQESVKNVILSYEYLPLKVIQRSTSRSTG